jgi:thiol-disulfide isomerase/thioredoxin
MDRLPPVIPALLMVGLAACQNTGKPRQAMQRVNAVEADPSLTTTAERFCEVTGASGKARSFRYPALSAAAPAGKGRPLWVNVWATWCKPCIEELPMLLRWQADLARAGAPFDLVLLSLDDDGAAVQRFRDQHPGTPPSLRIKNPALAEAWVVTLGLDKGAAIPIHVFVDARGQIRCARTGSLAREHFPAVQAILAGG